MFASFLLRVMCLTSYKTIQGVAVRRFPSSLVMLGYCFFQKVPVRFLPNRLCHVSGHFFCPVSGMSKASAVMLVSNKSTSKAKCFAVQLERCRPCLASHSVAAMLFTFPAAFRSPVLIC